MKWVKHGLCHLLAHRTLELRPDYQNMEDFMYSIPERFAAGEGTVVYNCLLYTSPSPRDS
mgnify:CR=1 FL=1